MIAVVRGRLAGYNSSSMSDFSLRHAVLWSGVRPDADFGAILSGSLYNLSLTGDQADARVVGEDWAAVGRDLAAEMNKYGLDGEEEEGG
jgi:hypothetical protein